MSDIVIVYEWVLFVVQPLVTRQLLSHGLRLFRLSMKWLSRYDLLPERARAVSLSSIV